ncbi:MAG: M3 family metallopeptidase [Candidatus Neomarinimicrobiota bacterium]
MMKFLRVLLIIVAVTALSCSGGEKNPLLVRPNTYIDFARITPADISAAVRITLADNDLILTKISSTADSSRSFANTLVPVDDIDANLSRLLNPLYLLGSVHPDSAIRLAADSAALIIEKYAGNLAINEDLYNSIKNYTRSAEAQSLTGWKKRYLDKKNDEYRRNGFGLTRSKREKIRDIRDRINGYSVKFSNNIAKYQDTLFVNEREIQGLPSNYLETHRTADGRYAIDISYASYQPFMSLSQSNDARRRLLEKYLNCASDENPRLLRVILRDRKQSADLLGYQSHAAYQVEEQMAKTPAAVWEFENNLIAALEKKSQKEFKQLLELKIRATRKPAETIFQWEKSYYIDQLAKSRYRLDNEEVREYFEVNNVLNGLFDLMEDLFELSVRETDKAGVWHEDVRVFEVSDSRTGEWIGSFYLDLYPRAAKYGHAALFDIMESKLYATGYQKPMFALVCNFPVPKEGIPSLLAHSQVETLFHEFGHGLHSLLAKTELVGMAGMRVARDFVETPSQVFEGWVWDKTSLQRFARHYQSGAAIPDELLDKMIAAKNMTSAINTLQQVFYGVLDFTLHDTYNPFGATKTTEIVEELQNQITPFPFMPGTNMEASFGHLIGYAAGYYSYLWAEVYARDIFSVFQENGVMDQRTARRYRSIILEKGATEDALELVREFLGREPDNKAFLKDIGL